jgi:hypothetical protein
MLLTGGFKSHPASASLSKPPYVIKPSVLIKYYHETLVLNTELPNKQESGSICMVLILEYSTVQWAIKRPSWQMQVKMQLIEGNFIFMTEA